MKLLRISQQDEQNLIAALDTAVKAGGLAVAGPCIDLTIKIQNAPVEPDEPATAAPPDSPPRKRGKS